ncbi:STAS/SEC14 domain-containing protein [Pontibacter sp. SGAir0037]|uniref:STAS/SEC14 domain-containing protein n=1 Tax=Pontibacter sp. SGAir0037 TaxID=2571030 RepID=UPI0010CD5D5E|nr:STAS/SEC14 domain-containing protein [Pontibacter sp. SGAir0037]QCR23181.1 STAS/SEC14 domain-containing protein [Pontibacter sp. SGAir0037]
MKQELTNPFGRVFLTIEEDALNKWIYVNWMGYLTAENIKMGANAYTTALEKAGYNCVLNDTRLIIGSWDHSMDWVINEWAPQAAKAGLKYFAMITTPETFADSSASNFYSKLTAFKAEVFDDMDKGKQWLKQFSL